MVEQILIPPLVLRDSSGEINIFRNVTDLLSWVEEVDVEGGEYTGWDSEGRAFSLSVNNESKIQLEPGMTVEPEYLQEVLAAYVTRIRRYQKRPLEGIASASLAELIEELAD
jgi:hypothetical protein